MSKILCCWELGEDYGHIGQFLPVIKELSSRGHDVFFALKDLSKLSDFDWPSGVKFLQAPLWLERSQKPIRAECYAEIILHKGYDSAAHLTVLVDAWRHLFEWISPDVLILDHSPTALVASRGLNIPRIIFSNPFVTPPPGCPPINLRPWQEFNTEKANNIDAHVTSVINQVCTKLNFPTIAQVSDLFAVEKTFLSSSYELDFYRDFRASVVYGRYLPVGDGLQKPVWMPGTAIKIFAYLKFGRAQVDQVLHGLSAMQARVVCFYFGARPEDVERYRGSSVVVSNKPFDMTAVYREAQVIICHAGGMVHSALHYGRPLILLPTQIEQQNTASKLKELGVATVIDKQDSPIDVQEKLRDFFTNPSYSEHARAFSERVKTSEPSDVIKAIGDECESLIHHC
jgi:UDP:flavonoid glycosyltransferase YjiC (YdhE family)